MVESDIKLPNLDKPKSVRFTAEQWEFLKRRAAETGVREPGIVLRQLVDRAMKEAAAQAGA